MSDVQTRVLIVDDQAANVHVLAEALEREHELFVATTAARALELATSADLILLDVVLPDGDGIEVCRRLRADPLTKGIPVIFVTALEHTEDEEQGFAAGGVDYIVKPIQPAIVRARVRTHLELKAARDRLERLATLDGLTGIANRRRFDQAVAEEWRRAIRNGRPLTLALADVDHFKAYNDRHGHQGGDACLQAVARALAAQCRRPGELAARYGGEEFGLVLPDVDAEGAACLAQLALDAVATVEIEGLGRDGRVTLSLGAVSLRPQATQAPEIALRAADEALYQAKGNGRRRGCGRDLDADRGWQVVTRKDGA